MKNTVQQVDTDTPATADPPEEILSAKEVAQDIGGGKTWVYAHADELGGYRVGRRLWFRWQRIHEGQAENFKRTQR